MVISTLNIFPDALALPLARAVNLSLLGFSWVCALPTASSRRPSVESVPARISAARPVFLCITLVAAGQAEHGDTRELNKGPHTGADEWKRRNVGYQEE